MKSSPAYTGRVPACGVYCGKCPVFIREKNSCPGAEINIKKCENCKSFHLCCKDRGINHCYECKTFPCARLKRFSQSWKKYGQDIIENQILLKNVGAEEFKNVLDAQKTEEN